MYGILPLVGVIYFWNKKGAEIIVGLCALLFIIVLVVRVISLVNTTKSYLVYDHSSGRLSFRNALVEHDGIDIPDIESIRTSITLITNSRHAHKKWYVANVDLISSEDAKYTVAQFEDGTPYGPTRQAQALARLLAAYFTRPYKHTDEVQIV
ncbi:MAG TPA: hypothetical protein PLN54_09920 [Flavobacteriales bacterium]|nr:hypothetical protein [Flavobacteriales bacterium]